ncbi:MAG: cytochrome c1 [Gammaproteobacteria bacterium]|nr:cytochrome c1 [Gammaproteobacteria bacterium]
MTKCKKIASLMTLSACLFASQAMAAGGSVHLEPAEIDPDNVSSLQRGARNFMNYCSGCHSAQYVRFNTIGKSLGLSEEQLVDNLMFNADKTFETIKSSMPPADAARWYGKAPPDMSLMARAKGTDYVYNFLKGFYVSPESPTGVDNLVLAGTSMPHVLWELQGFQAANFEHHENEDGSVTTTFEGFEQLSPGSMDAEDYDDFVRDTVNFLAYIAEPIRSDRRKLGVWVIMFLIFFFILSVQLKKQIWKDVK